MKYYLEFELINEKHTVLIGDDSFKNIYLGLFESEEQAALAYNEAALKYFGKYANINIGVII